MKLTTLRWLLLGLLLLTAGAIHAEGNCPPGYYPIGASPGQAGPQGCAPIPGYNNNQQQGQPQMSPPPPQQWEDHWGAIATYGPTGVLGTSTNLPDQGQAEQSALADCQSKGGPTCKIQLSYRNQCAVVVVGDKGYNATPGATMDLARQAGLKVCSDADTNCHVYYSACSLPVRTQ
jgi:Domain of unknown function (DUF4189)